MNTRLFIHYYYWVGTNRRASFEELDVSNDIEIPFNFNVADITDLSKKTTSYTLNFTLPSTVHNQDVIRNISLNEDHSTRESKINLITALSKENYYATVGCVIFKNNIQLATGQLFINSVNYSGNKVISYDCNIISNVIDFFQSLQNPSNIEYKYVSSVLTYGNAMFGLPIFNSPTPTTVQEVYNLSADGPWTRKYGYCAIDWKNKLASYDSASNTFGVEDWKTFELTPYVSLPVLLARIITDTGYKWESKFFRHQIEDGVNDWNINAHLPSEYRFYENADGTCRSPYLYNISNYPNNYYWNPQNLIVPVSKNPENLNWETTLLDGDGYPMSTEFMNGNVRLMKVPNDPLDVNIIRSYYSRPHLNPPVPGEGIFPPNTVDNNITTYVPTGLQLETTSNVNNNIYPKNANTIGANYQFVAPMDGWYELSGAFKWELKCSFYRTNADGPITGKVRYKSANWEIDNDNDNSLGLSDTLGYQINFSYYEESNGQVWIENVYTNEATCAATAMYNSGKKYVLKRAGESQLLLASSDEFEEHNTDESIIKATGENGWKYNKPVNFTIKRYLKAGTKIGIRSDYIIQDYFDGDWCLRWGAYDICVGTSQINIYPINEETPMFEAKLIDRVGLNRSFDWSNVGGNMLRSDFIKSLCKMFNLYIEDVSNKPRYTLGHEGEFYPDKTLYIDPRDFYYVQENCSTPYRWDWSDKVDYLNHKIYRPDEYIYNSLQCKYNPSSNEAFIEEYNGNRDIKYGDSDILSTFSATNTTIVDTNFAFTANEVDIADNQIASVFSNDKSAEDMLGKILFVNRQDNLVSYINNTSTQLRTLAASNVLGTTSRDPQNQTSNPISLALEFDTQKMYMFPKINGNFYTTPANLFNTFYSVEYADLIDDNARVLEINAFLTENDIANLRMNDIIRINNTLFYILKIENWVDSESACKLSLFKLPTNDVSVKSPINIEPYRYNIKKWYKKDNE